MPGKTTISRRGKHGNKSVLIIMRSIWVLLEILQQVS